MGQLSSCTPADKLYRNHRGSMLPLRRASMAVSMKKYFAMHICFQTRSQNNTPKPYSDIPGPRGLLGLGNLYQYLPIIGNYSWHQLHKSGLHKYKKYGPIVREIMIPGKDIVWLYNPDDIVTVLSERQFPQRQSHLALEKYRKDRPHIYRTAGLLPTNGSDWWYLRSEFQKELSAPRVARDFLEAIDMVTQKFVDYLSIHAGSESFDILPELSRLNLELTCAFTFGKILNSFSTEEHSESSRSTRLIRAAETTNSSVLPTDQGFQLWRHFETPTYRRLRKAQEYMESVAIEFVNECFDNENVERATDKKLLMSRDCLVRSYMKNSKLKRSDIVGIAADLLLAGIDTTSYTSAFAIYYIATNADVQARIHNESRKILPENSSSLMQEYMNSAITYTRAVLKEVYRMNPVSIGVGRILNADTILSGYLVPKGTVVVTQNMISCRLEENFPDPLRFNPDRWLSSELKTRPDLQHNKRYSINPFLVLPFGHGMRACIARRLAEQNMIVLILRLLRKFEITWAGSDEPLDVETRLINKPNAPVSIRLQPR